MSQSKKLPEKKEGLTTQCLTCEQTIFCRMTEYTGPYQNKLQWQYQNGLAHFTKDGDCKGFLADQEPKPEFTTPAVTPPITPDKLTNANDDYLNKKQSEIQNKLGSIPPTPETLATDTRTLTITLEQITREIEATLKGIGEEFPDVHKVGMFTKIIFNHMYHNTFKKANQL